ncbi:MAG: 2-aminoadipate transaminase [Gammaproteobacteria bacterium]|jgi:2-aminoadipate transaminase
MKATIDIARHLTEIQPSYIREILDAAVAPGVISLAGGLPASDLFPLQLFQKALDSVSTVPEVFQYGATQGYTPLLEHLRRTNKIPETHDTMVCNGSQQALDLIARAFIDPNDSVAMEAPSYLGALQVFGISQARIETVPQLIDGPDLNALETLFDKGNIKLFYAVPDFHNPTGICWSLDCRQKVADLCRHYNVALIEDAPYRSLRFHGRELPLVSSFCPERAFVLNSFSKISAPGIRIGTVTAPQEWLSTLITIKQSSDLHTNSPLQAMLLFLLMHRDFSSHIDNIRGEYAMRYTALTTAIKDQLTMDYTHNPVEGGMFIWLKLPGHDPLKVARAALEEGLAVVPGDVFFQKSSNTERESALRLNFSHTHPDRLNESVARLNRALKKSNL